MASINKLKKTLNLNKSPLNTNMIYCNNNLQGQEDEQTISRKPIQGCLNNNDQNIIINISNVSASFNVKLHLNLRYLALHGHNVEYRREKGVIY